MLAQTSSLVHKRDCVLSTSKTHLTGGVFPFTNVRRVSSIRHAAQTVCATKVAAPVKLDVQTLDGSTTGTAELALKVAGDTARGLVHRYLVTVRQNARAGTASTLTRAEVRGGGRKPFKQKGTGNARMGSKRSPLIPGGGVIFGPKPRDWSIKMNKKERRLAMSTALQSAANSIVVVEDLKDKFTEIKTKNLVEALKTWGVSERDYALLIMKDMNEVVYKSGRNMARLQFNTINGLKVYDILRADKIIIEQSALQYVQEFYGAGSA